MEVRHLAPVDVEAAGEFPGLRATPALVVRVAPVRSAAHLGERVVWQGPAGERGFEERLRWTERPSVYLERALQRAVAAHPGLAVGAVASATRLEVELLAFDLVRGARGEPLAAHLRFEARRVDPDGVVRVLEQRSAMRELAPGRDLVPSLARALGELLAQESAALAAALAGE